MADKTVSLKLEVDAQGAGQSVSDLKKSIIDLKNQALKVGEDTPLGKQFLKDAGAAKDRLSDLNRQVDNFQDAGAKFGAVTKLVGGLAAGFQAAQGAAALFGSAGEDIQKVMLKVQSATALAQGVQGIAGLGESFKDVGAIIKGPVQAAFTTLRGAIIATGIGALVVAAGFLYANFDKVKQVLATIIPESVQKAFGYLKDAIGGAVDKLKEWVGLGKEIQSKNPFGIMDQFTQQAAKNKKELGELIEKYKEQNEYLKKLSESGATGSIGYYNFLLGESNSRLEKLVPGSAAYNAELTKQLNLTTQLEAAQAAAFLEQEKRKGLTGPVVNANDAVEFPPEMQQELSFDEIMKQLELEQELAFQDNKTEIHKKALAERKALTKIDFAQSVQLASQLTTALQGIGDAVFANKLAKVKKGGAEEEKVLRKQFEFNKKLQLAGAIVDGAKAVIASLAQSPVAIGPIPNPAGIASLALVAVTTAASIAKIAATKFDSSGGGAVTAPSFSVGSDGLGGAPSLGSNQPTTNLNGQNQNGQNATQVYVTETDIKRVGTRVNVIEARARFG